MKKNVAPLILAVTVILLITLSSCNTNTEKKETKDTSAMDHESLKPAAGLGYADSVNSGLIAVDTMKSSPHRMAMANIGDAHIHIEYGSPGVKERIVWGGLVPYDKVWVTGAHSATNISFSKDVLFGDKKIAAGKYAFFTIPGKEKWIIIINKNYEQHLADEYNEADDIARITVTPEMNPSLVQRLTYAVKETEKNKGEIIMQWEKIAIHIPVAQE